MGRKKQGAEAPSNPGWLTTFADLTTLLMTFFVLLISMATIDTARQRKVLDSLVGSFGLLSGGRSVLGEEKGSDPRECIAPLRSSKSFDVESLRQITLQSGLEAEVQVFKKNDKIIVRIHERVGFMPDSFDLKPAIKTYLERLAFHLKTSLKEIEIQGHTDVREILKGGVTDRTVQHSWYLSSKRAQVVYEFLSRQGIPRDQMRANGFSHYAPVDGGELQLDPGGRNQRVDLVIGPNESIPETLLGIRPPIASGFNYKNFFFQFFPNQTSDSKGGL